MENVEMTEKDVSRLKGVSKAAKILTIIGKVCLIIAVPFIVLAMVAVPLLFKDIKVDESGISYKDVAAVKVDDDRTKIDIIYENKVVYTEENAQSIIKLLDQVDQDSSNKIAVYIDCQLGIALVTIIISIVVLSNLISLLKSIHDDATPFTMQNVDYLRKMACLQIINIVIPIVMSIILGIIFNIELSNWFNTTSIIEVLLIICLVYIFKYGCVLQEKTKITLE